MYVAAYVGQRREIFSKPLTTESKDSILALLNMDKILNFCCAVANLPRKFKAAVATVFFVMLAFGLVLGALDAIEAAGQFDGFWKTKITAWAVYFLTVGIMCWRIATKWQNGKFHFDEDEVY